MKLPAIMIGGGGHAKVLIEALRLRNIPVLGILDLKAIDQTSSLTEIPYLGADEAVLKYKSNEVYVVNGIGSVGLPEKHREIFERFKKWGYQFLSVIHPAAHIAADVELGEGVQIMAGAVIQPGSVIRHNAIINTNTSVDHDCAIGAHVHLAPGVTLCGGVNIGDGTHVGTGATVVQNIRVAKNSFIRAGSVIINDMVQEPQIAGLGRGK